MGGDGSCGGDGDDGGDGGSCGCGCDDNSGWGFDIGGGEGSGDSFNGGDGFCDSCWDSSCGGCDDVGYGCGFGILKTEHLAPNPNTYHPVSNIDLHLVARIPPLPDHVEELGDNPEAAASSSQGKEQVVFLRSHAN